MTITLDTKGLIEKDGSFLLEPSDFADLSLFIEAILSSNLANHAADAYGRFPASSVQVSPGRTINKDYVFLDAITAYNTARGLSANLYNSTSPMVGLLCGKIVNYANTAQTVYAELFDAARAYSENPTDDGPRVLISSLIGPLKADIDFVIQLALNLYNAFRTFEDGMTKAQTILADRFKLLQDLETWLQGQAAKLKPRDREYYNYQNEVSDMKILDTDVVKVSSRWQPALTGLQRLIGVWDAIKSDLVSVENMLEKDALFGSASLILDLNQAAIIDEWAALSVKAGKYTGKNRSFLIHF